MKLSKLTSRRFNSETGLRICVQVPRECVQTIVDHVLGETGLQYGDYDRVTFLTAPGEQSFRSTGTGRNVATTASVTVPCAELSIFLPDDEAIATRVVEAIYAGHPYEEPVIFVMPCLRTLHVRGVDEDNPNRFWNAPPADWVPDAHR